MYRIIDIQMTSKYKNLAKNTFIIFTDWQIFVLRCSSSISHMSRHMTKPWTKRHVRPSKTQISLGIRPVWSESSLSAWRKLGSLATHWAHSEDSDQTGWMPRLIWVFAGGTLILLVLSCWLVVLRLNVPVNNFSVMSGRSHRFLGN